jgi:hypothetical protein
MLSHSGTVSVKTFVSKLVQHDAVFLLLTLKFQAQMLCLPLGPGVLHSQEAYCYVVDVSNRKPSFKLSY